MKTPRKITSLAAAWRLLAEEYERYATSEFGRWGLCWVIEHHPAFTRRVSLRTRDHMLRLIEEATDAVGGGVWAYYPSPFTPRSVEERAEQVQGRVLFCLLMADAKFTPIETV